MGRLARQRGEGRGFRPLRVKSKCHEPTVAWEVKSVIQGLPFRWRSGTGESLRGRRKDVQPSPFNRILGNGRMLQERRLGSQLRPLFRCRDWTMYYAMDWECGRAVRLLSRGRDYLPISGVLIVSSAESPHPRLTSRRRRALFSFASASVGLVVRSPADDPRSRSLHRQGEIRIGPDPLLTNKS